MRGENISKQRSQRRAIFRAPRALNPVNIRITRRHISLFSLRPNKKRWLNIPCWALSRNIMLIPLIFLPDDVLSVMSFSFLSGTSFTSVSLRVPLFHARNCRVYEAHCIASSTSSRRSPTTIEKTLREVYSLRECLARLSTAERYASFAAGFITPAHVYRRVNHCAHPNASATFIPQSRAFTANKHIACR